MNKWLANFVCVVLVLQSIAIHSDVIAAEQFCLDNKWPSERSDLKPDPSLKRGKLDNGLRYIIKENREPENRVAVYLNIQAGSLHEEDNQRGLAHFLEHLMFNGSINFPPGSLIDFFQSIGMNFGGDTNAHTSYDETVYHIILPGGGEDDLDAGLLVMSDYARGALLLEEEIDRERGVIIAERRARDSAGYRVHVAESSFAFRGTKYPLRRPIGDKQVIKKADQGLLRSFYDSWYRPENMSVVVVGDADPEIVAGFIKKHFEKLVASGPKPECPDFGLLIHQEVEPFYIHEPELGKVDVSLETFWNKNTENDSIQLQKKELLQYIGNKVMGYRLEQLLEGDNLPFSVARYHAGDIINRIGYGSIAAQTDHHGWRDSLRLIEQTLRQALQYGFKSHEVVRAKEEILADLEARVISEPSQDSRRIARRIIHHLNNNRVYLSPVQEQKLYEPIVSQIGASDVNRAFRQVWNRNSRLISVTGDAEIEGDSSAEIEKAYYGSLSKKVVPVADTASNTFPYLEPPKDESKPHEIVRDDNGIKRLVFQNGLVVNLKQTDYSKGRFLLSANFGRGKQVGLSPGIAMIAENVINGSGSGRLSKSVLDAIFAGTSIDISFHARDSVFSWTGSGLVKDFELFTQLLYTLLMDPGVRRNVFSRVMNRYELMYQKMDREIEGADALQIQPFLASYNEHFGLPAWEELETIRYDDLNKWVQSFVKAENLEISVVGDINPDEVGALLTKYFGGVNVAGLEDSPRKPVHFPSGQSLDVKVSTTIDKALITVAWPTADFWDIRRTRRLQLLASVFRDRLRKSIRENLGVSYSPNVSSFGSKAYRDYGYIKTQMVVQPGREDEVINEILKISEKIRVQGVSVDEMIRAREPMITALTGTVKTNRYWLHSVMSLSSKFPAQLEWPKNLLSDYKSVSVEEMNWLAATYLDNSKAAIVRVSPADDQIGFVGK
ncbi:MAG: M16 family metallopeptidase [Desulforhopalus sp.]